MTYSQYGVFRADGSLTGTFPDAKTAMNFLPRYGAGAYVRFRIVSTTDWMEPPS